MDLARNPALCIICILSHFLHFKAHSSNQGAGPPNQTRRPLLANIRAIKLQITANHQLVSRPLAPGLIHIDFDTSTPYTPDPVPN